MTPYIIKPFSVFPAKIDAFLFVLAVLHLNVPFFNLNDFSGNFILTIAEPTVARGIIMTIDGGPGSVMTIDELHWNLYG